MSSFQTQYQNIESQDQVKGGNACVFILLQFFNTIFLVSAIGLIALSIWLWRTLNAFDIIEIFFLGLGIFQVLLFVVAYTSRKSIRKLRCYMIFLGIMFVAELVITIIAFALKDKIISKIAEITGATQEQSILKSHYMVVAYYIGGSLGLMSILIGFTCYYIQSIKKNNLMYDYKVFDESTGRQITVQQKNAIQKQKIQDKYHQKRQQLYQKYQFNIN